MKKSNWALLGLLALLAGCAGDNYKKIRLELPTYSSINLGDFQEIVITNFFVTKELTGINLNQEIGSYFKSELEKKFKGNVFLQDVSLEDGEAFKKPDLWKSLGEARRGRLIITGKAQLSQETRKAILGRSSKTPEGEYLSPEKDIEERRVFTLEASLFLISGDSGAILLQKDFKEIKAYRNPQQRADFAFSDLIQRIKSKLFRPILSEERIQDRYLLIK